MQDFIARSFEPGRPAADQPRVERVVAGVKAQVWIGRDPQHPAPMGVRRLGQLGHRPALLDQPVGRPAAQRLVVARVGPRVEPVVKLQLEVELVRERRVSDREVLAVALDTGELACRHPRSFARHRTITDLAHARALRAHSGQLDVEPAVEVRPLARYDALIA
jgi:hypothetical protein